MDTATDTKTPYELFCIHLVAELNERKIGARHQYFWPAVEMFDYITRGLLTGYSARRTAEERLALEIVKKYFSGDADVAERLAQLEQIIVTEPMPHGNHCMGSGRCPQIANDSCVFPGCVTD